MLLLNYKDPNDLIRFVGDLSFMGYEYALLVVRL
jgi:hypothetical protein